MMQRYLQIGQMDIAIGAATDRDLRLIEAAGPDDLPAFGGARNLADYKAQGALTSRRRRR
jgi:hypothetical protein